MDMARPPDEVSGEHSVNTNVRAHIDHSVTRMNVVTKALRDILFTLHASR